MASKARRDNTEQQPDERKPRPGRDEAWEDRLRLVGDARFVDVAWSGRDDPYWPLPKK